MTSNLTKGSQHAPPTFQATSVPLTDLGGVDKEIYPDDNFTTNSEVERQRITEAIINDIKRVHTIITPNLVTINDFSKHIQNLRKNNSSTTKNNKNDAFSSMYDSSIIPKFDKSYINRILLSGSCLLFIAMLILNVYLIILSLFYGVGEITTLEFSDFWCNSGILFTVYSFIFTLQKIVLDLRAPIDYHAD